MSDNGWYKTGTEGYENAQRIQEERSQEYGPYRFWINPGKSAKVTFLDTEGFYFHEHNLQINNKWGNYYTCLKDFSECPLCDGGYRPGYVCAYTVIDHSEYEGKNGIIKNQKKLLVARPAVMNKLARRRETLEGNLTCGLFLFTRDSKNECNTGEDIEFLKRLDKNDLIKFKPKDSRFTDEEWLKPFDYMTIFNPKPVDELRRVAGMAPPVGSDDYDASSSAGAVIPRGTAAASEQSIDDLL